MSAYHRATTVFSQHGQLLQVEYAQEAVTRSSTVVGVKGQGFIVLAVEKKSIETLKDGRTEQKIVSLDDHIVLAYSGLTADARVLISRSQIECQSHWLTIEELATTEYIAKYIAGLKQCYTQANGMRPFGLACLIAGFDPDGTSHLYQTDPSGMYSEWKATSIGKYNKSVLECLEKNYTEQIVSTERGAVLLAVKSLLNVEHKGQRGFKIAVLKPNQRLHFLNESKIKEVINEANNG